jgi:hypothetical protein
VAARYGVFFIMAIHGGRMRQRDKDLDNEDDIDESL